MVSLKSFKPIDEAERDDTLQHQHRRHQHQHHNNNNNQQQQQPESQLMQQHAGASYSSSPTQAAAMKLGGQTAGASSGIVVPRPASAAVAMSCAESDTKASQAARKANNIIKVVLPVVAPTKPAPAPASQQQAHLQQQQHQHIHHYQQQQQQQHAEQQSLESIEQRAASSPAASSISIVVVQHASASASSAGSQLGARANSTAPATSEEEEEEEEEEYATQDDSLEVAPNGPAPVTIGLPVAERNVADAANVGNEIALYSQMQQRGANVELPRSPMAAATTVGAPPSIEPANSSAASGHFEIVWSNLSCRVEPKWYKKINVLDRVFSHFMADQTIDNHSSATSTASSSAGMNDNQHQMHRSHSASADGCAGNLHNSSGGGGGGGCSGSSSGASSAGSNSCSQTRNNKVGQEPIEIFTNLNGTIKSGQMTAVLGPSGAGKTTLLNCLTGKLRKGVSGHINLLGANGKHLKMCTIPQKDHLLELLTVEENLWFASKIKNPELGFDHVKNIERVIDLLGLKRCRSAKIKKISGGQYKRVSIAQELLSNPDILVLDEPTSGLDSLTCYKTISMLRDLVELSAINEFMKPMAIIVTIHQPQPKVFNLFHHVYILANGGRVIYEGAPELSLETITSVTGLQPMDGSKSTAGIVDPASFLIEIASEEYGLEPIKTLSDHQRQSFYETNSMTTNGGGHMKQNLSREGGQFQHYLAKDNHGFAPDHFDNHHHPNQQHHHHHHHPLNHHHHQDKSSSTELSTIFVPNNQQQVYHNNKQTKEQQSARNNNNNNNNDDSDDIQMATSVISGDVQGRQLKGSKGGGGGSKRRKKSSYSLESGFIGGSSGRSGSISGSSSSTRGGGGGGGNDGPPSHGNGNGNAANLGRSSSNNSLYMSEQLLYTREANHKGRFWSHTATLTHRTLLTIRRDPLLMTSRVLFHLMIPILMGHVYGKATGAANACPHYEPEIDITQIPSLVEGKRIEYMLEELHMSIENVSMFFIIMYAFAAAVLALNALSFPLNMQVLLKETRNGWYSMSSYVLAKTLADLPLELTMPCLTMALVYPLTGQPSSYLQWRMLTICLIMTLCSLIAQTQALILGALVMNSVQTAVFVSQASQLPWVILAGFTIRIKRLSEPLKLISLTSFYRLGCEAITLTRYGFGICPCNPKEISGEPVRLVGIPDQLRTLAQYWIDSMEASKANNDTETTIGGDQLTDTTTTTLLETTTQMVPTVANAIVANVSSSSSSGSSTTKTDIFQHLANQLSYANSYGVNITSCDDVAPDRIRAINLSDNWLVARIWHLIIMLVIMKVILYYAVKFSIGIRL